MALENWQEWGKRPEAERTLAQRARGDLGEMESTKQLVNLVGEVYEPGMRVLDVGCNAGHYLRGLRRISEELDYTGVDAYAAYIDQATEIYADDEHARFEIRDIHEPLFPDDPVDIAYCCNVLLHLPDFRTPLKNLIETSSKYVFVRLLLGERTTIVKRGVVPELDDEGVPLEFIYQNTYDRDVVREFAEGHGCSVELIEDEFDPGVLADEHESLKSNGGTRIVGGGQQADGVVLFNWEWLKLTKSA